MKKFASRSFLSCFLFLLLAAGCAERPVPDTRGESAPPGPPQRVISTVPSLTEILFDIGVGDRIVGDSRFTKYPPQAEKIEKIGGLTDPNPERIVALRPDLVFVLEENQELLWRLESLDLKYQVVDHKSLEGVLDSYTRIGYCFEDAIREKAAERRQALQEELDVFAERAREITPVKVMVCVDRSRGVGRLQNLYVVGTNPFYQEVIRLAGGVNVAEDVSLPFPVLSAEGVVRLAPEVIVEIVTGEGSVSSSSLSEQEQTEKMRLILSEWQALGDDVPAVKSNRIHVLIEDYASIPGPRSPRLIGRLSSLLDEAR